MNEDKRLKDRKYNHSHIREIGDKPEVGDKPIILL
jgi:hypothetical protein